MVDIVPWATEHIMDKESLGFDMERIKAIADAHFNRYPQCASLSVELLQDARLNELVSAMQQIRRRLKF